MLFDLVCIVLDLEWLVVVSPASPDVAHVSFTGQSGRTSPREILLPASVLAQEEDETQTAAQNTAKKVGCLACKTGLRQRLRASSKLTFELQYIFLQRSLR